MITFNKNHIFTISLIIIISSLIIFFSIEFFNYFKSKVQEYDLLLKKAISLIDNQNFNDALSIFEDLYFKGYRTSSILKNIIYSYQITNQPEKMYIFIRLSSIDIGFNPIYRNFLFSILNEDNRWLIKINFIDYINKFIIVILSLFFIILYLILFFTIKNKKRLILAFLIIISLNFLIFCLFFIKTSYYMHRNEAISIIQSDIFNFPILDSTPIFTIQEYIKLKIIKNYNDFVLIKLPDGKTGWILKKNILKVINDK